MDTSPFVNPTESEIAAFLAGVRRIAVVGLSPRPERPSHRIALQLRQRGYTIVPVRPGLDEVLGEPAYPSLTAVPGAIDLVDVFRAAEHVPDLVEECIRLRLPGLWLQSGIVASIAAARARDAGLFVVQDRCLGVTTREMGLTVPPSS